MGVAFASGEELQSSPLRISSFPPVDIHGRVKNQAGLPIVGAKVEVKSYMLFVRRGPTSGSPICFGLSRSASEEEQGVVRHANGLVALTDYQGNFCIASAPAITGKLELTISHPDFAKLETSYLPYQPMMHLTLQEGATIKLCLKLPDGTPAVGFCFFLEGRAEQALGNTHRDGDSDAAGICEFRCMPPGRYVLRYFGGPEEPWALPVITIDRLSLGETRQISATASRGSVLCGRVLEATSKAPIPYAEVRFESEIYPFSASTFQASYTNADGSFEFGYAVVPGRFSVEVSAQCGRKRIGQCHEVTIGTEPRTEMTLYLSLPKVDVDQC
jgi:hypothetical protein